jgi:hypothetical protein
MAIDIQPGQSVRVTIRKQINRESARKTLERLFLQDKSVSQPLDRRSANFKDQPKRRGGCIWTKRTNKIHPRLITGESATLQTTPQSVKDLRSVESFISIAAA